MLPQRVAQAIREHSIFSPGERVLVAVSGGPDSVALLSILRELVPTFSLHLGVAHFDHGWREDSKADARFVADLAGRWGYPCMIGQARPDLPRTEDAARNARYAFFRETAAAQHCSAIALGHTQDDQVETLLLHLLRGSGAHGLAGMRPRTGDLARPLLGVSRPEIEAYLEGRQLTARHDPTNDSPDFTRNRMRQSLLPAIDAFDPAARRLLARTAELLAEDDRLLDEQAEHLPAATIEDPAAFRGLPVGLQRRLVRRLNPHMAFAEVESTRQRIALGASAAASHDRPAHSRLQVKTCTCDPATFKARDPVGHLDAGSVTPPLHILARRPGDRIQPLGFAHMKKLQDVLVDARVPRHLRDALPIVHDQQGLVWIPGVTVSERHRVRPDTREQLHLEIVTA